MIGFFLAPENTPFTIALCVMLLFTLVEVISASLGVGLSDMVDSLLPEFDADVDIDVDGAEPGGGENSLVNLLSWFRVGEVPVVMLFIIFLTGFGVSGLCVQFLMTSVLGLYLPAFLAVLIAIATALPAVRLFGGILAKIMPKDETYAVSEKSFIGMLATITLGAAQKGKPAQAKLKDKFGQTHYILVEPESPEEVFHQGEQGVIVRQSGTVFTIIQPTSSAMMD